MHKLETQVMTMGILYFSPMEFVPYKNIWVKLLFFD